ncbi:MAG: hypothetical protein EHM58_03610 [Ignavibacteriae bacterium]|nr:MAG: hypothetical protein EHM58_03610 [Ignavibacteriota bacterium]
MDKIKNDNISDNNNKRETVKHLRCINIDCVFNGSNHPGHERNTCNHPNLKVESKFADITIAICSEFRSKKDYSFAVPATLIDLKTNAEIEIKGQPDPAFTHIEKITTEELEDSIKETSETDKELAAITPTGDGKPQVVEYEKPVVIKTVDEQTIVTEPYLTTDTRRSDLQILKRLYQPYLKRGIVVSIIAHFIALWLLYTFAVTKDDAIDPSQQQRIVVVEDIQLPETPPPPNVQLPGEEPKNDAGDIGTNTTDVRPKITPKNVKPKIIRPKTTEEDTTSLTKTNTADSLKRYNDSLLAVQMGDSTRLNLPDSLKRFVPPNALGLQMWYPLNWKYRDNREINLSQNEFNGVIINTDSLSEDPGAVTIIIGVDDPKHSNFNKTTYKNTFAMDDSTETAFSTDPALTGSNIIKYKFFIFTDATGTKNLFVNADINKDKFEKYKPYVEAVVRSIKIAKTIPPGGDSGDNK